MPLKRKLVAVLLTAALGGASSDQPRSAGRVLAWPAHTAATGATIPPFTLFAWISPPVWATTAAHVAELAQAGMTLVLPAWADSGFRDDNLQRLERDIDQFAILPAPDSFEVMHVLAAPDPFQDRGLFIGPIFR